MKKVLILLLIFSKIGFSQSLLPDMIMGQTSIEELKMNIYKKDSTANALVLFEKGHFYIPDIKILRFKTDYYKRIKILNKDGLDYATKKILLTDKDKLTNLVAVTYNLKDGDIIEKTVFKDENIIRKEVTEGISQVIISLPNVKAGSVIEYKYTVSRLNYSIKDWEFQSDIPKIKSAFSKILPPSLGYKVTLHGSIKLSSDTTFFAGNCFKNNKLFKVAKCKKSMFHIDSIPAFKEEPLMSNPNSYISKLSFKLDYVLDVGYFPGNLLSSWKTLDKFYLAILSYNQKQHSNFFKRKMPKVILKSKDPLEKAKGVYSFIQDHFTWDGYLGGGFTKSARKQFVKKTGSVNSINTALYNSLQSAGIECYHVLLSTRGNGIPSKKYPEFSRFNYLIIKAIINDKEYFLDATNKLLPFGQVPDRCLNGEARIISKNKKSYWQIITPNIISSKSFRISLDLNNDDTFSGKISLVKKGYNAALQRELYNTVGKEKYIETIEDGFSELEISNHKIKNLEAIEKPTNETFSLEIDEDYINVDLSNDNIIRFNPILFDRVVENPFKAEKRLYPLDFVYKHKNSYLLKITLPNNYSIKKLPENIAIKLPLDGGSYIYKAIKKDNTINIIVKYNINRKLFSKDEYPYLKEFFNQILKAENSFIELEKQ
ncbi:MAG: DUF3857 domain-containing protein [Flavobacteriaceae bacterium]